MAMAMFQSVRHAVTDAVMGIVSPHTGTTIVPDGDRNFGGAPDGISVAVVEPTFPPPAAMSATSIDSRIFSSSQETLPGYSPSTGPPTYSADQLAHGIVSWWRNWWMTLSGGVNVPRRNTHAVLRDTEPSDAEEAYDLRIHRFDLISRNRITRFFVPPIIFLAVVGLTLGVWKIFKGGPRPRS